MEQKSVLAQFIEELQALEEPAKKRILVMSTIIAMAIIVYVWLGYLGSVISSVPTQASVAQGNLPAGTQPAQGTQGAQMAQGAPGTMNGQGGQNVQGGQSGQTGPGFFENIKNGLANIYNALRGPSQYEIKPSNATTSQSQ